MPHFLQEVVDSFELVGLQALQRVAEPARVAERGALGEVLGEEAGHERVVGPPFHQVQRRRSHRRSLAQLAQRAHREVHRPRTEMSELRLQRRRGEIAVRAFAEGRKCRCRVVDHDFERLLRVGQHRNRVPERRAIVQVARMRAVVNRR